MTLNTEQAEQVRGKLLEQVAKLPAEQQDAVKSQIQNATAEQLEAYVKPTDGGGCLFCGIAQGKIDTVKIYEDSSVVAFLDITPAAPGQVIITPKEHYQFIFQIPDQILWEMTKIMKIITPLIVNVTSAKGVSTYFAQGKAAGQAMEHFSINIIPRFDEDKSVFAWDRKEVDKKDLEAVGQKLVEGVQKSLKEERDKVEQKVKEEVQTEEAKKPENPQEYPERKA